MLTMWAFIFLLSLVEIVWVLCITVVRCYNGNSILTRRTSVLPLSNQSLCVTAVRLPCNKYSISPTLAALLFLLIPNTLF